jgi:integrase
MHNAGVPLRVIQRISGHASLATLQRYLKISDEQIVEAVAVIGNRQVKKAQQRDYGDGDEWLPF